MADEQETLRRFAEQHFAAIVYEQFEHRGVEALKRLLAGCRILFAHIAPRSLPDGVMAFAQLSESECPRPFRGEEIADPVLLTSKALDGVRVQILDSNVFLLVQCDLPTPQEVSSHAVVYTYRDGAETFYANGHTAPVFNVGLGSESIFEVQAFGSLRDALPHYYTRLAQRSTCRILSDIWHDSDHLFLCEKPEQNMRHSLLNFLRGHLRGNIEVRPEQNVDDTHPVDLKVTWFNSNRLALIEIKWLGISKSLDDGHITTEYSASRAVAGAVQLANYLDRNRSEAPLAITRGYLVVFDARRGGLRRDPPDLSPTALYKYVRQEIEYDPKYHGNRSRVSGQAGRSDGAGWPVKWARRAS